MQTIGIAIVLADERCLVGLRERAPLAGYREFPGGKCLPGETPADCAIRECREETGLEVVAVAELLQTEYAYPHGAVDLHFWHCRPVDEAAAQKQYRGYHWQHLHALGELRFPEANAAIVELLTASLSRGISAD